MAEQDVRGFRALLIHSVRSTLERAFEYDWSYWSPYEGVLVDACFAPTERTIDYTRLQNSAGSMVHFFDSIDLYEDEMADNGTCSMDIKIVKSPIRRRANVHVEGDGIRIFSEV